MSTLGGPPGPIGLGHPRCARDRRPALATSSLRGASDDGEGRSAEPHDAGAPSRRGAMTLVAAGLLASVLGGGGCGLMGETQAADSLAGVEIAPDLDERLARYQRVEIGLDLSSMPPADALLLETLIAASDVVDEIFWRQIDLRGAWWRRRVGDSGSEERDALLRYLRINGGRYDLLDEEGRAFLGEGRRPEGGALYPAGMTRNDVLEHLKAHPEQQAALEDPHAVVVRSADGAGLVPVPYHDAYRDDVQKLSRLLAQAASVAPYPPLARFLGQRSREVLTDDYFTGDCLWVRMGRTPIEVVIGPYETYRDRILGTKALYEAVILLVDEEASHRLEVYGTHLEDLEAYLPTPPELKPVKRGAHAPIVVGDCVYRAGDAVPGYQFVATNLPNDARVHQEAGSKKIICRNFLELRVDVTIRPIAERLMPVDLIDAVTRSGYFDDVLFHELSHGLGTRTVIGSDRPVRAALGRFYSAIEEAKADMCGLLCAEYFVQKGLLPEEALPGLQASFLAGTLRSIRFGDEAHAVAARMHLNRMLQAGVLAWSDPEGRFEVDLVRMPEIVRQHALDLLTIQARGDAAGAERLVEELGVQSPPLEAAVRSVAGVPFDFEPVYVVR